jgi:hypothetical protein
MGDLFLGATSRISFSASRQLAGINTVLGESLFPPYHVVISYDSVVHLWGSSSRTPLLGFFQWFDPFTALFDMASLGFYFGWFCYMAGICMRSRHYALHGSLICVKFRWNSVGRTPRALNRLFALDFARKPRPYLLLRMESFSASLVFHLQIGSSSTPQ